MRNMKKKKRTKRHFINGSFIKRVTSHYLHGSDKRLVTVMTGNQFSCGENLKSERLKQLK